MRKYLTALAATSFVVAIQPIPALAVTHVFLSVNNTEVVELDDGGSTVRSIIRMAPGEGDRISWTSGPNTVDERFIPVKRMGNEEKFGILASTARPVGRVFNGFTDKVGPGKWGSTVTNTGGGRSTYNHLTGNKRINAELTVTGNLGIPPQVPPHPVKANWEGLAGFHDPNLIDRLQLVDAGLGAGTLGLFQSFSVDYLALPLGLVTSLGTPSINLAIEFDTNLGSFEMLDITFNSDRTLQFSTSSDALFYQLDGPERTEAIDALSPITGEQIVSTIAGDLFDDGILASPLHFGAYLPYAFLFDGSATGASPAKTMVGGSATDMAELPGEIPLPAPVALLAGGIGMIALARRRRG